MFDRMHRVKSLMIYLSVKHSRNSSCLIERENDGGGSVGFEYSSIYNRVNILLGWDINGEGAGRWNRSDIEFMLWK